MTTIIPETEVKIDSPEYEKLLSHRKIKEEAAAFYEGMIKDLQAQLKKAQEKCEHWQKCNDNLHSFRIAIERAVTDYLRINE